MKKILFGSIAVVMAIAFVSFTNAETKSSKFVCTWFLFDDNSATNPGATGNADGVATPAESIVPANYKFINPQTQAAVLCSREVKLCAICADNITGSGTSAKPVLTSTEQVRIAIDQYNLFNDPTLVDNSARILEKL